MEKLILTNSQKRRRRILRWAGAFLGILLVLLVALALMAPRVINTDAVRNRIAVAISEATDGDVHYGWIRIRLFPLPRLTVEQVALSISGTVEGKIQFAAVYPEILPLFSGTVRVSRVSLDSPHFLVQMAASDPEQPEKSYANAHLSLDAQVARILPYILTYAPNMRITMENGRLVLAGPLDPEISLHDIKADIILPPKGLKWNITGRSTLFESVSASGILDPVSLAGKGRMQLSKMDLKALLQLAGLKLPVSIGERRVDAGLDFSLDGTRNIHARINGTLPEIKTIRDEKEMDVRGGDFSGSLARKEGTVRASLEKLSLENPAMDLSGELQITDVSPRIRLSMEARGVDVSSARQFTLSIADDVPTVQTIFSIVKGGHVPSVTFKSRGNMIADIGSFGNVIVEGRLEDGMISIPESEFNLQEVFGLFSISKGILEGTDLTARVGNSRSDGGTLRLDLNSEDVPFRLDTGVEADLTEVPPILRKYITDPSFLREMDQIADIRGRASGRLVLDSSKEPFEISVDLDEMDLSGHYRRIPHPLTIESGRFSFLNGGITLGEMSGSIGETTFTELGCRLSLEGEPAFMDLSGNFSVALGQVYPWLWDTLSLEEKLQGKITSVSGGLDLSVSGLKGPAAEPVQWTFKAAGTLKDVEIESSMIGGTARLRGGEITAAEDALTFREIKVSLLDSSLDVSGKFDNFMAGFKGFQSTLSGTVGLETERWLLEQAKSPPEIRAAQPLSLSDFDISWKKDTGLGIKGSYFFTDGPGGSIDAALAPESLEIKELVIKDRESVSTVGLKLREDVLDLDFSGRLFFSTLNQILLSDIVPDGHVSGDFNLELNLKRTKTLSAEGYLEGTDIQIPGGLGVNVTLNEFSLTASEKVINVEKVLISDPWNEVLYKGKIHTSSAGVYLEGELSTDIFNLAEVVNPSDREKQPGKAAQEQKREVAFEERKSSLWDLPLRGQVIFRAGKIRLRRVDIQPVTAYISFTDDDIEVRFAETEICGISLLGIFHATPEGIAVEFDVTARGREIRPTMVCMTDERSIMTGSYDMDLNISADGKTSQLLRSARGNLRFLAYDGHILKSNIFTGILGVLNLTRTYSGKIPDVEEIEEGFSYNSLTITAVIKEGIVNVSEGALDSSLIKIGSSGTVDLKTMQMDLKVLVAPLRLLNRIAKLPVLKQIFGGKLAAIPMKITGDISRPKVQAVSAATAGGRVLDIMTNTLKLPVTLSEELVGGSGDGTNEEGRIQETED